jgi:NAD(P)-dependent dehydrogenase (short-subunit alcohol dehydrogenase family)
MKVVLFGASGTIGKAIVAELGLRHEIVAVGSRSGDVQVDVTDAASIRRGFETIGRCDAVVSALGKVKFAPLEALDEAGYAVGLRDKLMGQVNLVLIGREFVSDGGSFTLTSGVLSHDPVRAGSSASMVNGALDAFVRAAAIELPRGLRINAVSPGVLVESMGAYAPFFRGHEPVPAARVALAYSKSVEGALSGRVFEVL